MKFFQTIVTKIIDYFTANTGRKIFFFGLLISALCLILYTFFRIFLVQTLLFLALTVAGFGTLWDTMYTRYLFLKKIRDMQYQHLKEIYDKQASGIDVEVSSTFSIEEKRYLRLRKWEFVMVIIFKVGILIALFSLLFSV